MVQSGDIACDGVMPLIQQELCGYSVITGRIILHGLPSIIHSLALDTQPLLLNTLVNYVVMALAGIQGHGVDIMQKLVS